MLKLQARGATCSTSVLLVAQARELMPQSMRYSEGADAAEHLIVTILAPVKWYFREHDGL
ncbi:uncharacterized protein BDR25DRAFT_355357 [Lindgomyces ingoldianus]|uniref:Uncharacterized protein n=1 Tax=Lindgomyces ingoldianus TaxID=673940 RepID=A0ACB6QTP5_9PLEO|nr:uncharacterized protein BDR25DRAFT_355357 [Lindgomyces ingoldianus]KAF2470250.1 hypothetical protein BDR25DRAFT_355357 [Lindgomyces ingoldianus]